MIKGNHSNLSTESINEVIATKIHELQGYQNYVKYSLIKISGKEYDYGCKSKLFTSPNRELVSAFALVTSEKKKNNVSWYDHLFDICERHGIDKNYLQQELEYQISGILSQRQRGAKPAAIF